jgi:NAD-dependent histone deacetylase SIR2
LYDESHPLGDDIGVIQTADLSRKPDMLIIMGTSLKVHGLKKLVKEFARVVHSASSSSGASSSKKPFKVLFVNKTAPAAEWSDIIDYHVSGETDRWSNQVIDDWKKMRPADWEIQQRLDAGDECTATGTFKSVKSSKPSNTSKPRHPLTERENVVPTSSRPLQLTRAKWRLRCRLPNVGRRLHTTMTPRPVHQSGRQRQNVIM